MRRLFGAVLLLGAASPALACINDSELRSHEREFRSQYGKTTAPSPAPSPEPGHTAYLPGVTGCVGAVLLIGAGVLGWRGISSRG